MFKYLLSTHRGVIPHIIENKPWMNHDLCVYIDDFYYKGSYYYSKGTLPINTFLNTKHDIFIKCRNSERVLETLRGRLKVTKEEINHFIQVAKPKDHGSLSIVDSTTLDDMLVGFRNGKVPTTLFVHDYVNKGWMVVYDTELRVTDKKICTDVCCKNYHKDYLEHLWRENEICGKTIVALHNYYQLNKLVEALNGDVELLGQITVINEV